MTDFNQKLLQQGKRDFSVELSSILNTAKNKQRSTANEQSKGWKILREDMGVGEVILTEQA